MMPLVSFFLLRAKGSNPHINTLPQIMTAKLKGWQWMREKHTWRKQTLKAGIDGLWHNWTLKPDESFFKVPFYFRTQWSMLFKGNWRKCSRFHMLTLLVYVCQASVFKPQHSLCNFFNYIFFHCLPVKTNRRLLPHCLRHNNYIKLHSYILFKKNLQKRKMWNSNATRKTGVIKHSSKILEPSAVESQIPAKKEGKDRKDRKTIKREREDNYRHIKTEREEVLSASWKVAWHPDNSITKGCFKDTW